MMHDARVTGSISRPQRWALWSGLKETGRQFRLSWIAIPVGVKGRCALTLAVGFVACLILTAGLTLIARWWAPRGLQAWDERVLLAIDRQTPMSYQNAVLLESFGNLVFLIPLVTFCAVVAARRRRPLLAIGFVASYVLARPIVALGWWLWDRHRPTLILDGKLAPPLHSYPSGHVVLALSVYGVLAFLWIRASRSWLERGTAVALLLVLVWVTGFARVRLGTHWPSDVIAGFIIGVAWLAVVLRALQRSRDVAELPARPLLASSHVTPAYLSGAPTSFTCACLIVQPGSLAPSIHGQRKYPDTDMENKMLKHGLLTAALVTGVIASGLGCESHAGNGALIGGAAGAGIGAIIGNNSKGRTAEGALIGGAVGAIGGGLIGNEMDKKEARQADDDRYDLRDESRRERYRREDEEAYYRDERRDEDEDDRYNDRRAGGY